MQNIIKKILDSKVKNMLFNKKTLYFFLCIPLLLVFISVNAFASVSIIVSTPPPLMEVVVPPASYVNCYVVPGGYHNDVWISSHRVCHYNGEPGRNVWISGYWGCTNYTPYGGHCLHWSWFPSHWMHTGYVEYGVHYYAPHYHYPQPHYYYDHHCYRHYWHGDHRHYFYQH